MPGVFFNSTKSHSSVSQCQTIKINWHWWTWINIYIGVWCTSCHPPSQSVRCHILSEALGHSYHCSSKQTFREGTAHCDKLWVWKPHSMAHKAIIAFIWGISRFSSSLEKVWFQTMYFTKNRKNKNKKISHFTLIFGQNVEMYSFDSTFSLLVAFRFSGRCWAYPSFHAPSNATPPPRVNHDITMTLTLRCHDDVIKWKHFRHYWPFVRGIHRSPVNYPHKCQWRGALMISLICVWINGWVNNREAADLRRYRAYYDVIVMVIKMLLLPCSTLNTNQKIKITKHRFRGGFRKTIFIKIFIIVM